MTRPMKIFLLVLLAISQTNTQAWADDRAATSVSPARQHDDEPDRGFCLSRPAECDGDYMLERDRQELRNRKRRSDDAARRSVDPMVIPARDPTPPLSDASRYRDFCLGRPSECSGNFVLDRDRFELYDRQSSPFGRRRSGR